MNNLLIVFDNHREDLFEVFKGLSDHTTVHILLNDINIEQYDDRFYKLIFYKSFSDAFDLIDQISPEKVVFLALENHNQFALRSACDERKIPTLFLDHGIRFKEEIATAKQREASRLKKSRLLNILKTAIGPRLMLKNSFYHDTYKKSKLPENQLFLKHFYSYRAIHGLYHSFDKINHRLMKPDYFISYSPMVFEFHKSLFKLDKDFEKVTFIGFPSFDNLISDNIKPQGKNVIFIDQPVISQKWFGWTSQAKVTLLNEIDNILRKHDRTFSIKLHPYESKNYLKGLNSTIEVFENWDEGQQVYDFDIAIGFNSTLLNFFAASELHTLFTVECHPKSLISNPSSYLTNNNVAEPIEDLSKFYHQIKNLEEIRAKQLKHKQHFIEKWLYKFDGNSTHRLIKALL